MTKIIENISNILPLYDVFILDQWGVMHDGIYGYNHESRGLELGRLFILPEFQRLGLMSNTLNYIINIIKTKSQIDYINLYCKPLNKSALSLYQSLGFKKDYLDFVLDEKGDKFFLRVR